MHLPGANFSGSTWTAERQTSSFCTWVSPGLGGLWDSFLPTFMGTWEGPDLRWCGYFIQGKAVASLATQIHSQQHNLAHLLTKHFGSPLLSAYCVQGSRPGIEKTNKLYVTLIFREGSGHGVLHLGRYCLHPFILASFHPSQWGSWEWLVLCPVVSGLFASFYFSKLFYFRLKN